LRSCGAAAELLLSGVPLIDVSALRDPGADRAPVAEAIARACRADGFFTIVGHGVPDDLARRLEDAARRFFALPLETKLRVRMALGGRAWRGFFPVGDELTSGRPDLKEGIYFGSELGEQDARVRAGLPLHGANLFPAEVPEMREVVLAWMDAMTGLGHLLLEGIALSLGLAPDYFARRYTREPFVLFRIFHYPPEPERATAAEASPGAGPGAEPTWGVGEHTDYGLLTILKQDDVGGLEVKSRAGWIDAPPVPGAFVCNLGDMLDRMTGGLYRSTPHRVRNRSGRDRYSFPFFFDPGWEAEVRAIDLPPGVAPADDTAERWDHASVHAFEGTYGEYLLEKVSKVFPGLHRDVVG
jgi:isopenicillin N synthase-like dioxygenase